MALPGVSLAPGTYIFRRPASNVLQVTNANREPYAMLTTTAIARPAQTDATRSSSGRPSPMVPARLEAWFAPGESTGQQPIYKQ